MHAEHCIVSYSKVVPVQAANFSSQNSCGMTLINIDLLMRHNGGCNPQWKTKLGSEITLLLWYVTEQFWRRAEEVLLNHFISHNGSSLTLPACCGCTSVSMGISRTSGRPGRGLGAWRPGRPLGSWVVHTQHALWSSSRSTGHRNTHCPLGGARGAQRGK